MSKYQGSEVSDAWEAQLDGWCPGCGLGIEVGQRIVRIIERYELHSESSYWHEGCADV